MVSTSLEALASHLELIDLLAAMFPLPGEFRLDDSDAVAALRDALEKGTLREAESSGVKRIKCTIRIWEEELPDHVVELEVQLLGDVSEPGVSVRRANHLTRSEQQDLSSAIAAEPVTGGSEYILAVVDRVRAFMADHRAANAGAAVEPMARPPAAEERIWFWFPSLSTREKRKDLVDYAGRYGLTGFVLAGGETGLLCVEGEPSDVDDYMSAIKSESWSDIPSYQKKVSERHRERITARAFPNMREITDTITQYGRFGNRGEMGEVKAFLEGYGVGDALGIVLGTGGVA